MKQIVNYIMNMLPYAIISIPIVILIRFLIYKKRKKINWYYEIALILFILFLVALASQTIIPKIEIVNGNIQILDYGTNGLNLIPFKVFTQTYDEVFINQNISYFIINFLGNIIMFIPIGFFIPLLWKIKNKNVILIGFCSSIFIEFCQLFLNRGTDIDDILLNTFGVFIGLSIYQILYKNYKEKIMKWRN